MSPPITPTPGDIWQWTRDGVNYTIVVIEPTSTGRWECLCLEDGDIDNWWFRGNDSPYWRQLA